MESDLIIRYMTYTDLAFAAECTANEGWVSENFTTFEGFFLHDPQGCLLAASDGKPFGICIATSYGTSGFIGELIVRPEARGGGIGAALLNHAVAYLHQQGVQTVYLDGVIKAVNLYERNGFRKICRSWRFSGKLAGNPGQGVQPMVEGDLPAVFALDRQAFGADRSFFLNRRWQLFPALCKVLVENGRLIGFIQGRRGDRWAAVGPWVIAEGASQPLRLLHSLAGEVGDLSISVGILETNRRAIELVRSLGFTERADSPWRMAFGPSNELGASTQCFAVGSAAKG
jgi:ribosomal protein S18 acetylase RimI-like enzyme